MSLPPQAKTSADRGKGKARAVRLEGPPGSSGLTRLGMRSTPASRATRVFSFLRGTGSDAIEREGTRVIRCAFGPPDRTTTQPVAASRVPWTERLETTVLPWSCDRAPVSATRSSSVEWTQNAGACATPFNLQKRMRRFRRRSRCPAGSSREGEPAGRGLLELGVQGGRLQGP